MKLDDKIGNVQGNAVFSETTAMTFDPSSTAFIMRSLTSMYSDPYSAIIREYSSNAYDSHVIAGQTKPVQITLPSYLNSNLIIQDFGIGMSRDELNSIYSKYGASTKRNSNDQIGAFGLGAKSALALVSQFTVVSVQNGKKNTVLVSKDATGVGNLNFLAEKDTDEPDGVTVNIPIPDAHRLKEAVNSKRIFMGWPTGAVAVDGQPVEDTIHNVDNYKKLSNIGWLKDAAKQSRERHYYNSTRKSFAALIGPVSYVIEINDSLSEAISDKTLAFFERTFSQIVIDIPNGSVDLTPNREELIYNERTNETIAGLLDSMAAIVSTELNERLASAEDIKDAFQQSINIRQQGFDSVELAYKGEVIPTSIPFTASGKDAIATVTTLTDYVINRNRGSQAPSFHSSHSRIERRYKEESLNFMTWDTYSREYKSFNNSATPFIIVNTPEPASKFDVKTKKTVKQRHAITSSLLSYFKENYPDRFKSVYGSSKSTLIYTVSHDVTELNKWFVGSAVEIIDYSKIAEFVRADRAAKALARKNEVVSAEKKKFERVNVSIPVAVPTNYISSLRSYNNISSQEYKNSTVDSANYSDDTKFIVIPEFKGKQFADSYEKLAYNIYRGLRDSATLGYAQEKATVYSAVGLLDNAGYVLVTLPASRNLEKTKAALVNVFDFKETFKSVLKEAFSSVTDFDKAWFSSLLQNARTEWLEVFRDADDIALINNEDTREWVTVGTSSRKKILENLINSFHGNIQKSYSETIEEATERRKVYLTKYYDENIAELLMPFAELTFTPSEYAYPLLNNSISNLNKVEDVVEYINLKDAAKQA